MTLSVSFFFITSCIKAMETKIIIHVSVRSSYTGGRSTLKVTWQSSASNKILIFIPAIHSFTQHTAHTIHSSHNTQLTQRTAHTMHSSHNTQLTQHTAHTIHSSHNTQLTQYTRITYYEGEQITQILSDSVEHVHYRPCMHAIIYCNNEYTQFRFKG